MEILEGACQFYSLQTGGGASGAGGTEEMSVPERVQMIFQGDDEKAQ